MSAPLRRPRTPDSISTAVILAAGAGTRLGELGRRYSKGTVPVAGRPLIAWLIEHLRAGGIGPIAVVGHPTDSRLARFLSLEFPEIRVVVQPARRGIADALRCALPLVSQQSGYLACACDSLFAPDDIARLIACGQTQPDAAAVGVLEMGREATTARSAVQVDGDRVVAIIEKPSIGSTPSGLVAVPLYWLPRIFAVHLETVSPLGNERYVSTALNGFVQAGGLVRAVPIHRRLEVTTAEDIPRAEAWLRRQTSAD